MSTPPLALVSAASFVCFLACACGDAGANREAAGIDRRFAAVSAEPARLSDPASPDEADRDCRVVLRSLGRAPAAEGAAGWEQACAGEDCPYVWRGTVDVADDLEPGTAVGVMYHLAGDPQWWEVAAEAPTATPGFARWSFALADHLFGPAGEAASPSLELVPFLREADGRRVFDHNRHRGDLENAALDAGGGFALDDPATCAPEVGFVNFTLDPNVDRNVTLRRGGFLQVNYDLGRLPRCRGTHNGHPAWDIVAAARFLPGGEQVSGTVRRFATVYGVPTNEATAVPFIARIPAAAERVELWFHNYSGAGNSCEDWDSQGGANYRFDVQPAADDPACRDVFRETGVRTEADQMVHLAPFCLPYRLASQADAGGCELRVEGFGDGYVGHYGIPYEWVVAYLRAAPAEGEVLAAGMFSLFRDNATGASGQVFALGQQVGPGVWKAGFTDHVVSYGGAGAVDRTLTAFAFFADVRRPGGEVVRLWQSRHGRNYGWSDAFDLPSTTESVPYGHIRWANPGSPVLACGQ